MIKRLYNWVLSWSDSRWGWLALFIIALFEASWFPLPPDVLLIALCLGATKKSFRFATICLTGSILGAALGYCIGHFLWMTPAGEPTAIANFFYENIFSIESFNNVGNLYDKYNFWIVFTAGFTPLPFKLFTIAGGMFDINFVMFIIASTVSRGMRFFLIGWLIWRYGAPIKSFIDKYFNLLATLFTVILIGFTALAFWLFGSGDDDSEEVVPTTEEVVAIEESTEMATDDVIQIEEIAE
ncbi:MAG: DedA family protein [Alistipes sp.]|nr:DedA family protein [Alistipes sp.]